MQSKGWIDHDDGVVDSTDNPNPVVSDREVRSPHWEGDGSADDLRLRIDSRQGAAVTLQDPYPAETRRQVPLARRLLSVDPRHLNEWVGAETDDIGTVAGPHAVEADTDPLEPLPDRPPSPLISADSTTTPVSGSIRSTDPESSFT